MDSANLRLAGSISVYAYISAKIGKMARRKDGQRHFGEGLADEPQVMRRVSSQNTRIQAASAEAEAFPCRSATPKPDYGGP